MPVITGVPVTAGVPVAIAGVPVTAGVPVDVAELLEDELLEDELDEFDPVLGTWLVALEPFTRTTTPRSVPTVLPAESCTLSDKN